MEVNVGAKVWANQTQYNYNSSSLTTTPSPPTTNAPLLLDKVSDSVNSSYQLVVNQEKKEVQSQDVNVPVNPIIDQEFPSPIDDVDFFNTERPGNMSMYNETTVRFRKKMFFFLYINFVILIF